MNTNVLRLGWGIAMAMAHSSIALGSNLTESLLGVPQPLIDEFEHVGILSRSNTNFRMVPVKKTTIIGGVTTVTRYYIVSWSTSKTGIEPGAVGGTMGMLHQIHMMIHEFGFNYQGVVNGAHLFYKPAKDFVLNGVSHHIGWQKATISKVGSLYRMETNWELVPIKAVESGKFVDHSPDAIALAAKMTIEQIEAKRNSVILAEARDPNVNILTTFPLINKVGDQFLNNMQVNGKNWEQVNYGALMGIAGKTGMSFVWRWRLYDNCSPSDIVKVQSGTYSYGNFGECHVLQLSKSDVRAKSIKVVAGNQTGYDSVNHTYTYRVGGHITLLSLEMEELPAQGKNWTAAGYYVLQQGNGDQPVGPAQRLSRVPLVQ